MPMMISIKIEIAPYKLKNQELLQALYELQPLIRTKKGCRDVSIYQHTPDKDLITYNEKWLTRDQLFEHASSKHFDILMGAVRVLAKKAKITLITESRLTSLDLKKTDDLITLPTWIENTFETNDQRSPNERP
jgi:quinol monooxygenase YgiN